MILGVLGTMVWDRIHHPDAPPVERWGGISYSLAAAAAVLPDGWTVRPLVKVGEDLSAEAWSFMAALPGLDPSRGVTVVPEPNNRVHLRYVDRHHRHECLTGGVGRWERAELEPLLDGLDALYVNLIAGFELDAATAVGLRPALDRPVYADLHSLLLGPPDGGARRPRPLDEPAAWLGAFDVVQVNQQELALVAGGADGELVAGGADGEGGADADAAGGAQDPWRVAERAVSQGLGALLVTRGPEGAEWLAAEDAPFPWRTEAGGGAVRRGRVPVEDHHDAGDPTGCGDVWGATCFVELVKGRRLSEAMVAANRAAAANVAHRGADGLYDHLRAEA